MLHHKIAGTESVDLISSCLIMKGMLAQKFDAFKQLTLGNLSVLVEMVGFFPWSTLLHESSHLEPNVGSSFVLPNGHWFILAIHWWMGCMFEWSSWLGKHEVRTSLLPSQLRISEPQQTTSNYVGFPISLVIPVTGSFVFSKKSFPCHHGSPGFQKRFGEPRFLQNLCPVTVSQDKLGMVRLRKRNEFF